MNPLKTLSGKIRKQNDEGPSQFQYGVLGGLQFKPTYQGTADHHDKLKRRKANKAARAARRKNRK